jgi:hypothetical protein
MLVHKFFFNFSIQQLTAQRVKFQHKICFKTDRSHLRLKTTPTLALTNRFFRDGKALRLYKNCNKFYLENVLINIGKLSQNNEFKNLFFLYQSFTDFNRVLFWRIMSINTLFNFKKLKNAKLLYYLRPERRMVIVLFWLKYIVKLKKLNFKNNTPSLFNPLINFICSNKEQNEAHLLKLKIYKLRVLRG